MQSSIHQGFLRKRNSLCLRTSGYARSCKAIIAAAPHRPYWITRNAEMEGSQMPKAFLACPATLVATSDQCTGAVMM